jgi:hypothetical protein
MRRIRATLAATVGLLITIPQAMAEPASRTDAKGAQCFSIRNFQNWKALDARTLYFRVDPHRYFRLDLAASCPAVLSLNSHLITNWRGSSWVCSALDWDLKVSEDPMRRFASPCIVKTMTALTDKEAAAIPRKFKP